MHLSYELEGMFRVENGAVITASVILAKFFKVEHADVSSEIQSVLANMGVVTSPHLKCLNSPYYTVDRIGFSLLAIEGDGASCRKLQVLEGFDEMERRQNEMHVTVSFAALDPVEPKTWPVLIRDDRFPPNLVHPILNACFKRLKRDKRQRRHQEAAR